MPRKKQTAGELRGNEIAAIQNAFMELIPPSERKGSDGFTLIDHPEQFRRLWDVMGEFYPIREGDKHKAARLAWYPRFREEVRLAGAFRKGGKHNADLWDKIQRHVDALCRMG